MDTMEVNKRGAMRTRTLIGAKILFNGGHSVLDCVARNLSSTGARLQIENALSAPATFKLVLSDGRRFCCDVVWRKNGAIGVRFSVGDTSTNRPG